MYRSLATALLPWLVWSVHWLFARQTIGADVLVAWLIALVILVHILSLVIFAPFLGLFVLFELTRCDRQRVPALIAFGTASLLGLGLAAMYWIPSLLELPLVKSGQGLEVAVQASKSHFIGIADAISFSWVYPYGSLSLGIVGILGGLLGLLMALRMTEGTIDKKVAIWFFVITLAYGLMMTNLTRAIWEAIPISVMIAYPWRLSFVVNLGLAILVGCVPAVIFRDRWFAGIAIQHLKNLGTFISVGLVAVLGVSIILSSMLGLDTPNADYPGRSFDHRRFGKIRSIFRVSRSHQLG